MKKYITDFTIVDRAAYGEKYVSLTLQHPDSMPEIAPGQFVEVEVKGVREVMLRRPISVHDVDYERNSLSLLVQIVGRGTARLASLKVGDCLNLVYPLGHGFTLPRQQKRVLLVGGGAGSAPLLYLAKQLDSMDVRPTILLGGRTAALIPVQEPFARYGDLRIATDDGSWGEKGTVTQHSCFHQPYDHIYTCGPSPMMKAVARYALANNIGCEVSLENMMACGVGACLCCVCDTDEGHRCVCKEGPVFNAKKLTKWIGEK